MKNRWAASLLACLLSVALVQSATAQHFHFVEITDLSHSVLVLWSRVDGQPMQPNDEVAAFDPQGVCAGVSVYERVDTVGISLWGDDLQTDLDEGFVNGDAFAFRLWDARHQIEMVAQVEILDGDAHWISNGLTFLNLSATGIPRVLAEQRDHDFGLLDMTIGNPINWHAELGNTGNGELRITSILHLGDSTHFQATLDQMSVAPDDSTGLSVTFPTGDFQPGAQYEMTMNLFTNAPDTIVSYHFIGRIGAPRYALDQVEIDFGEAWPGGENPFGYVWQVFDTLNIANNGDATMKILNIDISEAEFRLTPGTPDTFTISPGASVRIPIVFHPSWGIQDSSGVTHFSAWMVISTNSVNDPQNPRIHLIGVGNALIISVGREEEPSPMAFSMLGAYPNPFNGFTTIRFTLPTAGSASLAAFDMSGREVARLVEGELSAGVHQFIWQAEGTPTGAYMLRLAAGGAERSIRVELVK